MKKLTVAQVYAEVLKRAAKAGVDDFNVDNFDVRAYRGYLLAKYRDAYAGKWHKAYFLDTELAPPAPPVPVPA